MEINFKSINDAINYVSGSSVATQAKNAYAGAKAYLSTAVTYAKNAYTSFEGSYPAAATAREKTMAVVSKITPAIIDNTLSGIAVGASVIKGISYFFPNSIAGSVNNNILKNRWIERAIIVSNIALIALTVPTTTAGITAAVAAKCGASVCSLIAIAVERKQQRLFNSGRHLASFVEQTQQALQDKIAELQPVINQPTGDLKNEIKIGATLNFVESLISLNTYYTMLVQKLDALKEKMAIPKEWKESTELSIVSASRAVRELETVQNEAEALLKLMPDFVTEIKKVKQQQATTDYDKSVQSCKDAFAVLDQAIAAADMPSLDATKPARDAYRNFVVDYQPSSATRSVMNTSLTTCQAQWAPALEAYKSSTGVAEDKFQSLTQVIDSVKKVKKSATDAFSELNRLKKAADDESKSKKSLKGAAQQVMNANQQQKKEQTTAEAALDFVTTIPGKAVSSFWSIVGAATAQLSSSTTTSEPAPATPPAAASEPPAGQAPTPPATPTASANTNQ